MRIFDAAMTATTNIETEAFVVDEPNAPFKLTPIILDEMRDDEYLIEMKYTGICHTVGTLFGAFHRTWLILNRNSSGKQISSQVFQTHLRFSATKVLVLYVRSAITSTTRASMSATLSCSQSTFVEHADDAPADIPALARLECKT